MQASNQQQQQKQSAEKKQTVQTFDDSDAGGVALCPHCGAELDDGADFCGDCGKPVTEKASAQEAAAQGAVAQATAAQTVRTVEAPAPAKPETAVIEAFDDNDVYDPDDNYIKQEPEPVIEEEPVRKSFFSDSQMSSIRKTGADIESAQKQRAQEARIAEEKRLAEERRREAKRQAAQQVAAQQAEAERQRQAREAQAQEQARIAAATSAQVRQQTLQVPSGPSIIGIWTLFDDIGFGYMDTPPDFDFREGGVLIMCRYPRNKYSWEQKGNSVTVKYSSTLPSGGSVTATYELEIINPKLMQGTMIHSAGNSRSVEWRRKK